MRSHSTPVSIASKARSRRTASTQSLTPRAYKVSLSTESGTLYAFSALAWKVSRIAFGMQATRVVRCQAHHPHIRSPRATRSSIDSSSSIEISHRIGPPHSGQSPSVLLASSLRTRLSSLMPQCSGCLTVAIGPLRALRCGRTDHRSRWTRG